MTEMASSGKKQAQSADKRYTRIATVFRTMFRFLRNQLEHGWTMTNDHDG